jgi:hypothetical protein
VRHAFIVSAVLALAACVEMPAAAPAAPSQPASNEESRHEGYYYPPISSQETYQARARTLDDSDKQRRLGFVSIMLAQQLDLSYPPQHILFAKGDDADKLIIVGFGDSFETLYRARAVMAGMTVLVRETDLFRAFRVEDFFTFYDLLKMLGFRELVISDGRAYAHRVTIE